MENIFVEFLPPWVETGLQPAFYDKESGTVLQQTARMYARVNMLIRMFNRLSKNTKEEVERFEQAVNDDMTQYKGEINATVADYIERFTNLYNYVHDYFDNLDVQEEINNKLDEMAELGELTPLIREALNPEVMWTFDTVADLKQSTNLEEGCYARTLGFHSIGDDGGAIYKITASGTANEMDVIAVGNLFANLVKDSTLNVKQFGAYGDSSHGDSSVIQYVFNDQNCSTIYFPKGIYICQNINMSRPIDLIGEESTITNTTSNPLLNININGEYRNHFIKNLRFINNGTGNCVETNTTSSFITSEIKNCFFHADSGWGLKTNEMFSHSLVELCTFSKNGIYLECGDANTVRKCMFYGIGTGIRLSTPTFGELNNTIINNTIVSQGYAIHIVKGDQIIIEDNQIEYGGSYANANNPNCHLFIDGQTQTCHNIVVTKNNFGGTTRVNHSIVIHSGKHCKITENRFTSCTREDINVLNYYGGSNYNIIKNNMVYSTATYPKTDKWQPVTVTTDFPQSLINVWLPLTLNNTDVTGYYMRDENNIVHIRLGQMTFTENTTVIATLPTGYRPAATTVVNGTNSTVAQSYTVSWNGDITISGGVTGATNLGIDSFMADMLSSNID